MTYDLKAMKNTEVHQSKIGKRVHRYLFENRTSQVEMRNFICQLSKDLPETVVFGGMIRDLSLGSTRKFNSDIDLVSMTDRASIRSVIRHYNPEINKFGGFRFAVGRQLFDIWAFHDTWAFREGLVKATSFSDLRETTFFNMDAAYQALKSRKTISSIDYIEAVKSRTLDINLEANPAPDKIAARAIHLAIEENLAISPRLQSFILKNAKDSLWRIKLTGSFLTLMAKHREKNDDQKFFFRPQTDLFS